MASNSNQSSATFLTVRELADRWKTSQRTIWRMIADGRLRVHRIGRLVRITLAVILIFEAMNGPAA